MRGVFARFTGAELQATARADQFLAMLALGSRVSGGGSSITRARSFWQPIASSAGRSRGWLM